MPFELQADTSKIMLVVWGMLLIFAVKVGGGRQTGGCSLKLWEQDWTREPLMLKRNNDNGSSLLAPLIPFKVGRGKAQINLNLNDSVILACPGSLLSVLDTQEAEIICEPGNRFSLSTGGKRRRKVEVSSLGCSGNPKDTELVRGEKCGPEGSAMRVDIGFSLKSAFLPLLKICHSSDTEDTHWVQHTIQRASLGVMNHKRATDFKEGSVFFGNISADQTYNSRRQKKHLSHQFGVSRARKLFSPAAFDRGHLAPNGDFAFRDWQEATFFYANVVPQWRQVNRGNWKQVEEVVRKKAGMGDVEVVTGTLGILKLDRRQVWLGNHAMNRRKKMIPVPKVLWKVVTDIQSGSSIVLITLNNPLYKRITRRQVFCTDICEETGWDVQLTRRKIKERGYTFCCDLQDFKQQVPWLPDIKDGGVLHFA